MNVWWSYFWPVFASGLIVGGIAGSIAFHRRSRRTIALSVGLLASVLIVALWHGPLGAADRFTTEVERNARQTLDHWEMYAVSAHLHRAPLTRRLILVGPADDFQSNELVRIMGTLPGVSGARWSDRPSDPPLLLESAGVAILGFLLGLLLAYLIELRRRYNAQWNW